MFADVMARVWNAPRGHSTISNTRATFAYYSFCDNLRLQCTSQSVHNSLLLFNTILNYFLPRKSDVIKITRTHSMAMMISGGLN